MIRPGFDDPFAGITPDPALWAEDLARPAPAARFVIHFTPRSSSTRLTDILSATGRLGKANEVFNPTFMKTIAQAWKVADLDSYIALLLRRQATRGVFSCEVTAHHLHVVFPDETPFLRAFEGAPCFWLIRRDIVAQAVSLAKMVKTNIGHSAFSSPAAREAAEAGFAYDAAEIRHWLLHIRAAETASEDFFARHGMTPLRICYEQVTRMSPEAITAMVTQHAGLPPVPDAAVPGARPPGTRPHEKLGTAKNAEFTARFRAELAEELARIEAERAPMLDRLHDMDAPLPTAAELRAAGPLPSLGTPVRPIRRGATLRTRLWRLRQRLSRSRW